MALAGDLALISAPSAATQFVFRRVAGNWQQQSSIAAIGNVTAFAPPFAYFGGLGGVLAFSISPDGTGSTSLGPIAPPPRAGEFGAAIAADGQRVVIGAPRSRLGEVIPQPGAASVHGVAGGTFSLEQHLEQALGPSDAFGHAVAIDGNTALVGAPGAGLEDANGIVRWLERRGGRWVEAGELTVPGGGRLRAFGGSIALQGGRALIGATGLDATGTGFNREAWLFRRDGAGWVHDATLAVPAAPARDDFGVAVGLAGGRAVVGAPLTWTRSPGAQGAVHAFVQTPAGWVRQQVLAPPTDTPGQVFGTALALDESTLLVGAPSQSNAEPGAVHVYARSDAGWVHRQTLVGDNEASRFGSAIFLDAENAWVGAPNASSRVFRFQRLPDGSFGPPQRFDAPPDALGFGGAIAGGGNRVLVGAAFEGFGPSTPTIPGAVYRIERVAGAWGVGGRIAAGDYSPLAQHFGFAIAADAGAFIIGAPRTGSDSPFGNPFEGAAFVVDDQTLFADGFEP